MARHHYETLQQVFDDGVLSVKPLDWEDRMFPAVHPQYIARTELGPYHIHPGKGGRYMWWHPTLGGKIEARTLAAAKAEAFANYQKRLLSGLTIPSIEGAA